MQNDDSDDDMDFVFDDGPSGNISSSNHHHTCFALHEIISSNTSCRIRGRDGGKAAYQCTWSSKVCYGAADDQADSPGTIAAVDRPSPSPANLDTATPSPAAAGTTAASGQQGQDSTPAHQQLPSSGLHVGLSAHHSRPTAPGAWATAQGSTATAQGSRFQAGLSPAASLVRPTVPSPHFREMQVH